MWRRMPASSPPHCALVLALAALLPLAATVAGSAEVAGEGEAELPAAALDRGDECSAGSSEAPSCSLSALQLRRAKRSRDGARSAGEGAAGEGDRSGAFESAPAFQGSWSNEGRCAEGVPHELFFVMNHRDSARIDEMVLDRARPGSPNFRKWLSRAEAVRLTRNEVGLQAVKAVLGKHSAVSTLQETAGGEIVRAVATVGAWEQILSTEFSTHRHRVTGRVLIRAPSYSLPEGLHAHVAGILKAVELGEPIPAAHQSMATSALLQSRDSNSSNSSNSSLQANCTPDAPALICDSYAELQAAQPVIVSPPVLRRVYDLPPVAANHSKEALKRSRTSQMVYASLNQHWSPADRAAFVGAFDISPPHNVEELDLGDAMSSNTLCKESPGSCAESNLDVQYMTAMSPWSKMGYFYMPADTTFYEFLYRFIVDISEMRESPHVISISYGMPEAGATRTAQFAFDTMAMSLALQGVTILVASGDDGAASSLDRSHKMGPCWLVRRLGLQVNWPASSPWVTAVGATMGAGSGSPEVVCSVNATGPAAEATARRPPLITSGGGFSTRLKRPRWQDAHHGEWGRGVPDVALAGHAYAVVLGGKWLTVDGTSASSPAFGGMVSLINAERLAAGRPRLGFLNPLLYAHPEAFNDVTQGDNRCGSMGTPCCGGYEAGEGWDATTGLGSVNFRKLEAALLADGS